MDGELLVQLGHERGLVEMRSPPPAWWRPACFNGATSARSWKFAGHLWGMSLNVCFNGATSARSWKYRHAAGHRHRQARLQWGHERALVEIAPPLSYSVFKDLSAPSRPPGATRPADPTLPPHPSI